MPGFWGYYADGLEKLNFAFNYKMAFWRYNPFMEQPCPCKGVGLPLEYIRGEVVSMTAYEILSTIQDAAAFLVSVGIFVVTLLAFLDQRNKHK